MRLEDGRICLWLLMKLPFGTVWDINFVPQQTVDWYFFYVCSIWYFTYISWLIWIPKGELTSKRDIFCTVWVFICFLCFCSHWNVIMRRLATTTVMLLRMAVTHSRFSPLFNCYLPCVLLCWSNYFASRYLMSILHHRLVLLGVLIERDIVLLEILCSESQGCYSTFLGILDLICLY